MHVCSTWPSGRAFTRFAEGPEFEFGQYIFLFTSFLFFSFFSFFFSFSFHFRYNSFVMFLYIAHNFWLTNFLLGFTCRSPKSFAGSCDLRISSSYVVRLMVPIFLVHIWNDLPPPLKSQEEGTRNAFNRLLVIRPPFCLFWTQWLATATCLAAPQADQQQQQPPPPPTPPKKHKLEFTQDYLLHFILP